MKKPKHSDSQIMQILKQASTGVSVPDVCREHGISSATFYKWRSKYGGMDLPMITKLKELESENARLKKMYAEERLRADILKEVLEKK
jgi:putative transposase